MFFYHASTPELVEPVLQIFALFVTFYHRLFLAKPGNVYESAQLMRVRALIRGNPAYAEAQGEIVRANSP